MKENNHNTFVVYLLNDIDRHFDLIEIILACLKTNMKHSQNIDVETLSTPTCDVTMHKMVVPYNSNVCENSLVQ